VKLIGRLPCKVFNTVPKRITYWRVQARLALQVDKAPLHSLGLDSTWRAGMTR